MNYESRMTSLQDRIDDMTEAELECLRAMHRLLAEVKETPQSSKYDPVQFIEDMEYTMQGIWGFSRDRSYHTHWKELKGCTCPKLDNAMGMPYRITTVSCPHHNPETPF